MTKKNIFTKTVVDYEDAYRTLYIQVAEMLVDFKVESKKGGALEFAKAESLLNKWDHIRGDFPW